MSKKCAKVSVAASLPPVNFADKNAVIAYKASSQQLQQDFIERTHIGIFIEKADPSPATYGQAYLYISENDWIIAVDPSGKLLYCEQYLPFFDSKCDFKNRVPAAVVIDSKVRRTATINVKRFLVLNADDPRNIVDESSCPGQILTEFGDITKYDFPSMSFRCLTRFYLPEKEARKERVNMCQCMTNVMKWLGDGTIRLLDYVPDERRPLTKAQAAFMKEKKDWRALLKQFKSPGAGFNLVGGSGVARQWHRTATVLLHDQKKDWYLLLGRDGQQYFGVQLPKKCTSVEEALEALIPKEARGVKGVLRQGEWFAVPVDQKEVPAEPDCVLIGEGGENIWLARKVPTGSQHFISDYQCEMRVRKDGKLFVKDCCLVHGQGQHDDLYFKGWANFYENTAVRSFSEGGVD